MNEKIPDPNETIILAVGIPVAYRKVVTKHAPTLVEIPTLSIAFGHGVTDARMMTFEGSRQTFAYLGGLLLDASIRLEG